MGVDRETVEIRAIGPGDRGAWLPLWRGYQAFYEVALPQAATDCTWARLLDPTEPVDGALAWRGDDALGLVHHIRHRSCWTVGDYCYLQDLFVAESARGAGIGRGLITHVCAAAEAAGCARVHWLTHESNAGAMRLYDRIAEKPGFVQYRKIL